MDRAALTAELRSRAEQAGFDLVGVTGVGPLQRDGEALTRWLAAGHHAGMEYMAREPALRSDPGRLLEGCRSVVCLAMNYWPGDEAAATPQGRARVALYAQGRDYHRVMGKKLRGLTAWLEQASGAAARSFVDTGPVLERAWAERAGLGWIGKNANLISRRLGSWFLLGEILSAADLVTDAGPHADFCGSCNACIEACPTAAIVGPGQVDSSRCISYWTIEHRGPVPVDLRGEMGEWIFGCDVCQEVCPWNRSFARPVADDPFERRDELAGLDAEEILGLDEGTFRARYSGTALMRAKWQGMRRNACLVLGHRRQAASAPALIAVLADADPVVRSHAAWALGRIGGPAAREALAQALESEADPQVTAELRDSLGSRP